MPPNYERSRVLIPHQVEGRLSNGLLGRLLVLPQQVLGVVQRVLQHHVGTEPKADLSEILELLNFCQHYSRDVEFAFDSVSQTTILKRVNFISVSGKQRW